MKLAGKLIATVGVVAGTAGLIGTGTFASFSAQATNPSNAFATGTLVLGDKVGAGTACLSTGAGTNTDTNSNSACDTAFNVSVAKPGDSATASITLKNEGTINGSALKAFAPSCTASNATGQSYNGSGNPCTVVQVYVQQYSDAAMTTPSACLYGGASGNTCDFSDTAKTLAAFSTSHGSAANGLSAGALNAGSSAYIKVGVKMLTTADNTMQGRKASIDLSWNLEQ